MKKIIDFLKKFFWINYIRTDCVKISWQYTDCYVGRLDYEAIHKVYRKTGMLPPIKVDEMGWLIEGYPIYKFAKAMKIKHIPCKFVKGDKDAWR